MEESDYIGDNTHPTKAGSGKIADYLKDKVAGILGWDSGTLEMEKDR